MHELIEARRHEIVELRREVGVRRLAVFGSAVDGSFDVTSSDVDVTVEFAVRPGFDHVGNYFSLKEGLEAIFGRPVDLVGESGIRNPYFRQRVRET
ncbi:hypothetical protein GCM10022243_06220 [Saccharothrix violaceirubra]|uniref:Polymerase nucleotidyl transferase domain-containing protein n=1 Tax=Saccharothrix violaceirubra TaxID=413306 RepID=A0A7W7WTF0_9PSEU|nr:nucleotidyltransferase domain-containing protein [Saccharothrix violaceirubra]MBB4963034.1 hypothetical protein [Saccharothrix violaceirubra]